MEFDILDLFYFVRHVKDTILYPNLALSIHPADCSAQVRLNVRILQLQRDLLRMRESGLLRAAAGEDARLIVMFKNPMCIFLSMNIGYGSANHTCLIFLI